jgi:hypothetical protein
MILVDCTAFGADFVWLVTIGYKLFIYLGLFKVRIDSKTLVAISQLCCLGISQNDSIFGLRPKYLGYL